MGWNVAPCQTPGCALASGHEGEHRSAAGIEKQERNAGMWRLLILVGIGAVVYCVINGSPF